MAEDRFVVERAAEYSVAPQYRPSVVESHLSKYVLEVDPLAFDKDRASFSYRSPGLGVIQNSTVEIAFTIRVTTRSVINLVSQLGPQWQLCESVATAAGGAVAVSPASLRVLPATKIAFGSGDAMQKAISSMQIVVNGAAIAQTRQRDYMRSLQKCWFDRDVFQKRFAQCGGTPHQYDTVGVQGETLLQADGAGFDGTGASATVAGFTGDSGVRDQIKNLIACQVEMPVPPAGLANGAAMHDVRDYRIKWRVNGTGLFNPLSRGDKVSSSCPYKQSARALPHMNVVSINILFQDLFKSLVRNYSSAVGTTNANGTFTDLAARLGNGGSNKILIDFPPDGAEAKLYVEFLRLPSWRAQSGTALLQTYRVAIHTPTNDVGGMVMPSANVDGTNDIGKVIRCTGSDRYASGGAQFRGSAFGIADQGTVSRDVQWSGITAAQIPQYLFVVLEKSMDLVNLENLNTHMFLDHEPLANAQPANAHDQGRATTKFKIAYAARNSDGNAAISQFHLEIMSVQGSYIYSSDKWPYVKNRCDLYRDVQKYCVDTYDDQDTWFKHNCIVLLGAAEFAKGISSPGAAFPCTFTVKCRFENWRCYVDGLACKFPLNGGLCAQSDIIGGRPVLGFIYPQQSLQISASSALLSSQNISHASALELLSRQ